MQQVRLTTSSGPVRPSFRIRASLGTGIYILTSNANHHLPPALGGNRVESDRKWVEIPVPLPTPMSPSRFLLVQTARSWGGVECHKQLGVGPGKPFVATQVEAPPVRLNEVASLHGLVKDSLFTLGRAGNGRRAWTVATLFLSKSKGFSLPNVTTAFC